MPKHAFVLIKTIAILSVRRKYLSGRARWANVANNVWAFLDLAKRPNALPVSLDELLHVKVKLPGFSLLEP